MRIFDILRFSKGVREEVWSTSTNYYEIYFHQSSTTQIIKFNSWSLQYFLVDFRVSVEDFANRFQREEKATTISIVQRTKSEAPSELSRCGGDANIEALVTRELIAWSCC